MDIQIRNDASEIIYNEQQEFPLEKLRSAALIEDAQSITLDFAQGDFREMYFDGYHIAIGGVNVHENIHITTTEHVSTISLMFVLNGQFDTGPGPEPGNFAKRRYKSLEHNLFYNPTIAENTDVEKQRDFEMISLSFSKEKFLELAVNNGRVLDQLADKVAGDKIIYLNRKQNPPITTRMMMVLEEIRRCQFTGGTKKLYLQSKVLELLALQCEQHENVEQLRTSTPQISPADREKLYYARDLLMKNIQSPPSLPELSRMAGLNEFKLKNGFRQLFDNSVFGYLNDHRMEYARKLILRQESSMSEIAESLGFSSLQHFSVSFKKKYGVSPSRIK
ncbi:helix-turn-helix transcriptional regulator [Chitinophaga rhizophila]|uniref:AraC family transcriptional regulator n=1 Tax=Chitinophaga rhizophila TaxID=2866212 RepID=A0ABS7GDU1_9BACT|nr:AraC family transcriptional regulator [Chitinophaga rhizophila]MBW8684827.1 AraC family transcriptional regulator [Chitinophaga rhizophila]